MSIVELTEKALQEKSLLDLIDIRKEEYDQKNKLDSLQEFLNDLDRETKISLDKNMMRLYSDEEDHIPGSDEQVSTIQALFPIVARKIWKKGDDIGELLQRVEKETRLRLGKYEYHSERLKKKITLEIFAILDKKNITNAEKDVTNLVSLIYNSPHQEIALSLKRTLELLNPQEESNETPIRFTQVTQETPHKEQEKPKLNYYPDALSVHHHTIVEDRLPAFAKCNVFYYEEDYYDYVSSQTMLIEIKNGMIKHENSIQLISQSELRSEECRLPRPTHPQRRLPDVYFFFRHPGRGMQCIGGIKYHKTEKNGIVAKGEPEIYIWNHHESLRYGTQYINKYNRLYRGSSAEDNGDMRADLIAKETAYGVKKRYRASTGFGMEFL